MFEILTDLLHHFGVGLSESLFFILVLISLHYTYGMRAQANRLYVSIGIPLLAPCRLDPSMIYLGPRQVQIPLNLLGLTALLMIIPCTLNFNNAPMSPIRERHAFNDYRILMRDYFQQCIVWTHLVSGLSRVLIGTW